MASNCIEIPTSEHKPAPSFASPKISIALPIGLLALTGIATVSTVTAERLLFAAFVTALIVATWIDTKTRLIPNRLTYPLVVLGIVGNLLISLFASGELAFAVGVQQSLTGAAACFGIMLLLFLSNATGGGDVKLATAIGAFLGPEDAVTAIAWCHVVAGAFAIGWMIVGINLVRMIRNSRNYFASCMIAGGLVPVDCDLRSVGKKRIPMAAFFTIGVVITQLGYRLW